MTAFLAYLAAAALVLQLIGAGVIPVLVLVLLWFAAGLMVPWLFARDDFARDETG